MLVVIVSELLLDLLENSMLTEILVVIVILELLMLMDLNHSVKSKMIGKMLKKMKLEESPNKLSLTTLAHKLPFQIKLMPEVMVLNTLIS